ncbi:MAG: HAMP domain-containing protein [Deltaproteobacteria bacterium]|nr:HAMP domain-containing protein [Deltaproteobacteria bacterium]
MRIPIYSLRTGILAQLVFLIVAAMLLIHVVEVKFSERDLIQAKAHSARLLILALEQNLGFLLSGQENDLRRAAGSPIFQAGLDRLLLGGGFEEAVLVDRRGDRVFSGGETAGSREQGLFLARETLKTATWSTRFAGTIWGVIWLSPRDLIVSAPLSRDGKSLGAVSVRAPLGPIYETLRKSQKLTLVYILLDTFILTVVGIVLLSRIVVKPIHRLLKMTKEYKDGEMIPMVSESARNEIGELSRSFTVMLKRLQENKKDLKAHIASLEEANKDLQQAQKDLIRSEKLASVGRLAAGIAHEIGNPIGICLGYLELLRKGDVTEEEGRDFLHRMEAEITRINRIIRQLLDFSRTSSETLGWIHVHEVILNTLGILKPQPMMQGVHIRYTPDAGDDLLMADANRLQQVFLNIIMNAADALSDDGGGGPQGAGRSLTIGTRNTEKGIEIEFTDSGRGIPEEYLTRIFDPFYTTKEPGKGTGLGLSVVYSIVESMGGAIRVDSSVGKGTTFVVTLPLDQKRE